MRPDVFDAVLTCLAHTCSGLLPSLIGVCHVAIQFPLYEWSKKKLAERNHCDPNHLDAASLVGPLLPLHDLCQLISCCQPYQVCVLL